MLMKMVNAAFITDSNGIFIDMDNDFCRITGYSRDELAAMGMADLLLPDQWAKYRSKMSTICERGLSTVSISGLVDKNGTEHSATVSIVKIPGNLFLGTLSV